jgi:hypothetical protein
MRLRNWATLAERLDQEDKIITQFRMYGVNKDGFLNQGGFPVPIITEQLDNLGGNHDLDLNKTDCLPKKRRKLSSSLMDPHLLTQTKPPLKDGSMVTSNQVT